MKRRLVKQGAATMMVSLPSKWIKENNLTKGSEIDMELIGNNLVVSAKPLAEQKTETTIKLTNLTESSIRTLITNTYRSGYDRITVLFDNEKQLKILNDIIKTRLIGFDVIKKEKNQCVVENITEPTADNFDNIMSKIFYNIEELFDVTKKRLEEYNESLDYEEIEQRMQSYDNFCRRVISKRKIVNKKSEFLWTFLALLIHAQREVYHINKILDKHVKISPTTKDFLEDSKKLFEMIKQAYFEKNIGILGKVHESEKQLLYKKGYELLQKKSGKESIILYHIMVSIREFYQANSPLSGLIM